MPEDDLVDRREAPRVQLWSSIITASATVVVAFITLFGTLSATGRSITSDSAPKPTVTVTATAPAPAPSGGAASASAPTAAASGPKVRNRATLRVSN